MPSGESLVAPPTFVVVGLLALMAVVLSLLLTRRWIGSDRRASRGSSVPNQGSRERLAAGEVGPNQGSEGQAGPASNRSRSEGAMKRAHDEYKGALRRVQEEIPGAEERLEIARTLRRLADAILRHRSGKLQDLSRFGDVIEDALGFGLRVETYPGMGDADLHLVVPAGAEIEVGRCSVQAAEGFREATQRLQKVLRAWLRPIAKLLMAAKEASPPSAVSTTDEEAAATPRSPNRPAPPRSSQTGEIDMEGFDRDAWRAGEPYRGATRDAAAPPARTSAPPSPRGDPSPIRARPPAVEGLVEPAVPEPTGARAGHYDAPSSPDVARADASSGRTREPAPQAQYERIRPDVRSLPPSLARVMTALAEIEEELPDGAPSSIGQLVKLFTKEPLDRTSLVDRVDRFVYSNLRAVEGARGPGVEDPTDSSAIEWLEAEQDRLREMLSARFGFRPLVAGFGETFEHLRHHATETIECNEAHLHRTIARVLANGYVLEGDFETQVLQKVRVEVYVLKTPQAAEAVSQPTGTTASAGHEEGHDAAIKVEPDGGSEGSDVPGIWVLLPWRAGHELRAWIETSRGPIPFRTVEIRSRRDDRSELSLRGATLPVGVPRGEAYVVVEDDEAGRRGRHPFEVIRKEGS